MITWTITGVACTLNLALVVYTAHYIRRWIDGEK